jgi:hypothetical protein
MKILSWLIGLFVPRETPPADPPAGDPPAGDPPAGDPPGGRPDWCPEKFFDPDTGVRAEVMAKSFTELESKMREGRDKIAEELNAERLAQAPEKYEFNMPDAETLKVPEGVELTMKEDDPILTWFHGFAKSHGFTQEIVDSAVTEYIKLELAGMPDMKDEIGKLGDYGQDRLLKVQNWMEKGLGNDTDAYKALQPILTNAAAIEALETLMGKTSAGDFDGENAGKALTLEELRTMQDDPRYWQTKDRAYIKKVQDGYARLYKGQTMRLDG